MWLDLLNIFLTIAHDYFLMINKLIWSQKIEEKTSQKANFILLFNVCPEA